MSKVIHKCRLCRSIEKELNSLQKQLLDIAEVITPRDRWDFVRSKVLRLTNDSRRKIVVDIEDNYVVDILVKHQYNEEIRVSYRKNCAPEEAQVNHRSHYELGQLGPVGGAKSKGNC